MQTSVYAPCWDPRDDAMSEDSERAGDDDPATAELLPREPGDVTVNGATMGTALPARDEARAGTVSGVSTGDASTDISESLTDLERGGCGTGYARSQ